LKFPKQAEEAHNVPAGEASGTGLTKSEILGTLGLGLIVAGVAAAVAWFAGNREKQPLSASPPDHPRRLVEFNLTDRSGRSVSQADLAGKFLVVNFVFTSCSLSCRAVNDRMEEIQRLMAGESDVRLVSLTVDPRSDTPSVLAKFADGYHADTNRWLFLTGDKAEVYRVIETSFIPKSPELEGLIPGGFASTDRVMLVDPEGDVWASFDGLKRDAASAVVAEIEGHRKKHHHL
jgi:cytochrome oxidase Cu insertion factor (SCO1/SenC/PrrC family)